MHKIRYRLAKDMINHELADYYPYLTGKCKVIIKKRNGYYLANKNELKNDALINHFIRGANI